MSRKKPSEARLRQLAAVESNTDFELSRPARLACSLPLPLSWAWTAQWGTDWSDHQQLEMWGTANDQLAWMLNTGLLGSLLGVILSAACWAVALLATRSRQRRLADTYCWRPRQGARHPKVRQDTYDRFLIERDIQQGCLRVGLRRWRYKQQGWRPGSSWEIKPRDFAPGQQEQLDAWEEHLREQAAARCTESAQAHSSLLAAERELASVLAARGRGELAV